jgi:segregation and condensation protein A
MILDCAGFRKFEAGMPDESISPTDPTASPVEAYQVRLPLFQGPLDLLLHLIEKQELDITTVSLAAVTDQYLAYISHAENISADSLADFLVVAAKLLLIKSRALLPAPPAIAGLEPEEDVGDDLVRQLLEYRRFKELARQLADREEDGLSAYVRLAFGADVERPLDLSQVSLNDLLGAVRQALAVAPPAPPVNGVVGRIVFTVADKIQEIEGLLAARGSFSFNQWLRAASSLDEIIVAFLALLELLRTRRIAVQQERLFAEILVLPPEDSSAPSPVPNPPQEQGQTHVE